MRDPEGCLGARGVVASGEHEAEVAVAFGQGPHRAAGEVWTLISSFGLSW